MKRHLSITLVLAGALAFAGCGKKEPAHSVTDMTPPPTSPATAPSSSSPSSDAMAQQQAADSAAMAMQQTCSIDCAGTNVSISCAEGQKAVCDCTTDPRARCESAGMDATSTPPAGMTPDAPASTGADGMAPPPQGTTPTEPPPPSG